MKPEGTYFAFRLYTGKGCGTRGIAFLLVAAAWGIAFVFYFAIY